MGRCWAIALAGPVAVFMLAGAGPGTPPTGHSGAARIRTSAPTTSGRVWVYFRDKGLANDAQRAAAIASLQAGYDPHATERRRLRRTRPGLFDESDLPVSATYRAAVESLGARVHVESPWLNAVSIAATPAQIARIAALPFVRSVEPVRAGRRLAPGAREGADSVVTAGHADDFYGLSHDQLNQINLIALHMQGYTGAGVRIGILDSGFRRTHPAFNDPTHPLQVIAEHDFVRNDGNTAPEAGDDPEQHWHGTAILGTIGAYQPDALVGGAYDAAFILCKTEDITSETPVEEDNYVGGLQFIEAHGGDVATASLVYSDWYTYSQLDGHTAVTTIAVNIATANGLYCCNAAGNSGHDSDPATGHLGGAPADALQVISVGAVHDDGTIADFSSDGPTADGRLKPELLARGVSTVSVNPDDDSSYITASGTSLSTPLAASAVACLAQARPWWTVDQMRQFLFSRASDEVASGMPDPLMIRGYGIINAAATLAADCYANCDASTEPPVLNVNDFLCFQNLFAAGDPRANCDLSTAPPVLNVNDFVCFQQRFVSGCP